MRIWPACSQRSTGSATAPCELSAFDPLQTSRSRLDAPGGVAAGERDFLLLATSLFGDVAAALREHGSATLGVGCYYVRHPE
jgi:hypothetical protein